MDRRKTLKVRAGERPKPGKSDGGELTARPTFTGKCNEKRLNFSSCVGMNLHDAPPPRCGGEQGKDIRWVAEKRKRETMMKTGED